MYILFNNACGIILACRLRSCALFDCESFINVDFVCLFVCYSSVACRISFEIKKYLTGH